MNDEPNSNSGDDQSRVQPPVEEQTSLEQQTPAEEHIYHAELVEDAPVQPVNVGSPFRNEPVQPWGPNAVPYVVATAVPVWMPQYERYSARAGAMSAIFLGVMSILGGLVTPMAIVNAMLGLLLGSWGLTSERKRIAMTGIVLCGIGIAVTLVFTTINATR